MIVKRLALPILSVLLMFVYGQAHAVIYNFTFGSTDIATLEITEATSPNYNFSLSFDNEPGGGNFDFIDQLVFDITPATTFSGLSSFVMSPGVADTPTTLGSGTLLQSNVSNLTSDFDYDAGFQFAAGSGSAAARSASRFEVAEAATWGGTFNTGPVTFNNIALVFRNNGGNNPIAVAGVQPASPIPEPQAYMMFLAGIGLMGFAARPR